MSSDRNRRAALTLLLAMLALPASSSLAQTLSPTPTAPPSVDPLAPQQPTLSPLTMPTLSAGQLELVKLEGNFSDAVAKGGGAAFAAWFADDGVTLQNGQKPVQGRAAIAAASAQKRVGPAPMWAGRPRAPRAAAMIVSRSTVGRPPK